MGTPMLTPGQYQASTSRQMGPPMGRPLASMQTPQYQATPRINNYPPHTTPVAQSPRDEWSGGRGMDRSMDRGMDRGPPRGQAGGSNQMAVDSQALGSSGQPRASRPVQQAVKDATGGLSQEDWAKKAAMWAKRDQAGVSEGASKATPKRTPRNSPYRTPVGDQTPLVDEDR